MSVLYIFMYVYVYLVSANNVHHGSLCTVVVLGIFGTEALKPNASNLWGR